MRGQRISARFYHDVQAAPYGEGRRLEADQRGAAHRTGRSSPPCDLPCCFLGPFLPSGACGEPSDGPSDLELMRASDGQPLYLRIKGLLSPPRRRDLMQATLAEQRWFVDASTGGRDGHRLAQVLYTATEPAREVEKRVGRLAPQAYRILGGEPEAATRVECQQTVHLDGGFYRRHADDQGGEAAPRALTYVYYHHRLPRAFSGGELILYGPDDEAVTIDPADDMLVLFASDRDHEVAPVSVPSGDFADGRFTVNGWLWR